MAKESETTVLSNQDLQSRLKQAEDFGRLSRHWMKINTLAAFAMLIGGSVTGGGIGALTVIADLVLVDKNNQRLEILKKEINNRKA